MKVASVNSKIVKGDLFGTEIEPGTFHSSETADGVDRDIQMPILKDDFRGETEVTLALEGLIPPIETDISF